MGKSMVDKVQSGISSAERKMNNAAESMGDKMVESVKAMESGLNKAEAKLKNLENKIK
ncbi:MAG: hypothetical protein RSA01_05195 [Clostridium sp.]|uniref:hypothetical protein n=1 Tax=Clostridium sp. TaxID=1506 RepID=UPI002FCA024D